MANSLATWLEQRKLGLASMRERAAGVGGTLRLESQPGEGTRISVDIRSSWGTTGIRIPLGALVYPRQNGGDFLVNRPTRRFFLSQALCTFPQILRLRRIKVRQRYFFPLDSAGGTLHRFGKSYSFSESYGFGSGPVLALATGLPIWS